MTIGTAAALIGALPSCSTVPWSASVLLPEGRLSYSAKGGIDMEYAPGHGEMPAAYAETQDGKTQDAR
jgi:hypothetical protein